MILTDEQKKHYESIRWLIMGPRGSGRSTLLAMASLEKAISNRGMWIDVLSHASKEIHRNHRTNDTMRIINNLVAKTGVIKDCIEFNVHDNRIRVI